MATPAQEAFAEGFSALASVHGSSWTFGDASFAGVATVLKPDDPRMAGSNDRLFEIVIPTAQLPETGPTRGDDLVRDDRHHRVARVDHDANSGLTTILIAET
jgi:hypothetical protein